MSNPFIELNSPKLAEQRRRAQRFQIGVYAVLMTMTVFLLGMLIQGCNSERPGTERAAADTNLLGTTESTPTATNAPAVVEQSTNAPAPVAAAVPAVEQSTSAPVTIVPQPIATNEVAVQPSKPATPASDTYVVKSGDTLERIAKTHGTTVRALRAANHLKTDRILVGKKLKIPRTSASAPEA